MIIVADKLSEIALRERDVTSADLFGRSAFNRYYYASYLLTRSLLTEFDSTWARTPHSNIPSLLRDTIRKRLRTALLNQAGKLISWRDAKEMRAELNAAVEDLASVLTVAYLVRCIADYEPDIKASRNGPALELCNHTIHEASGWPRRAIAHTRTIRRIWRTLAIS